MINKKLFYAMAGLTLIGFSVIGFIVAFFFSDATPEMMFEASSSVPVQLGVGALYGIISGFCALFLIKTPLLDPVNQFYGQIIRRLDLDITRILIISISAGIGEEILFRGAFQPLWGIWITAFVFVAIHGYLNPMNWRLSVYGIAMTCVIAGIGRITEMYGLISAIVAHALIDIILLIALVRMPQNEKE